MEWLKDLKPEELPENYREMLAVIGAETKNELLSLRVVLALATHYNKQGVYFSGLDVIVQKKKREYVLANRGKRASDLARVTGWSERTIYDIYEEVARNRQRDLFNKEEQDVAAQKG